MRASSQRCEGNRHYRGEAVDPTSQHLPSGQAEVGDEAASGGRHGWGNLRQVAQLK